MKYVKEYILAVLITLTASSVIGLVSMIRQVNRNTIALEYHAKDMENVSKSFVTLQSEYNILTEKVLLAINKLDTRLDGNEKAILTNKLMIDIQKRGK